MVDVELVAGQRVRAELCFLQRITTVGWGLLGKVSKITTANGQTL